MIVGDGGAWLRRQCLALARTNHTPIDFWLSLRLSELMLWIESSNALIEEGRKKKK